MISVDDKRVSNVVKARPQFASKTLFAAPKQRQTLNDMIGNVRDELVAGRVTTCPSCHGAMRPVRGRDRDAVIGGRCRNCGATLS